jgi:hypothetical protein
VYDDQVAVLSPDGRMLRSVSITQALLDSPYDGLVAKMKSNVAEYDGDILHTNDLDFVSPEAFGLQGTSDSLVLVSMRYLSAILVVDLEQEKVVWAFSGLFHRQHDPTLLEPGRFLIFDNGTHGTWSRAIEFDVASQRVEWQFPRVRSKELYSDCCGGAQRLPNGNTLINFSGMGRALEVTPDGEVAWEFRSPHRSGESEEYIAQLMNLQRLPVEQAAWIQP